MKDHVVLVTGGARGIGLGIVRAFAGAGCKVMIADLSGSGEWLYDLSGEDDLEKARNEAEKLGEVASCALDVTNSSSCSDAIASTVERFGRIDVLVNNAGIIQSAPILECSEEQWDQVLAVNTKGIFLMTKAALPELMKSTDAAIVNIASIAGKKGHPRLAAYCASKFAAIGLTQSLAAELAPHGIRVNALCPGFVETSMWLDHLAPSESTDAAARSHDFESSVKKLLPMGRPQTVEDMGEAAVYLASARNVSGVALSVDGGFQM